MSQQESRAQHLMKLHQYLQAQKKHLEAVLPKHITADRLTRIACSAVSRSPKLLQCTMPSLYMAISQAAQLGLEPGLDCHLVPFWNKDLSAFESIMIPDYKGLISLALRSDKVKKIEARVVYVGDIFDYEYGTKPFLLHKPARSDERSEQSMEYAYAVAWLSNGELSFDVMDRTEISKVQSVSRARDSGPWKEWPEEMWKKTVVRRLSKYLPKSTEFRQALQIETAAESGERPIVGLRGEDVFEKETPIFDEETKSAELTARLTDEMEEPDNQPEAVHDEGLDPKGTYTIRINGLPKDEAEQIGMAGEYGKAEDGQYYAELSGLTMSGVIEWRSHCRVSGYTITVVRTNGED